jgi:signal peptidase I
MTKNQKSKKGTWSQAFLTFLFPIIFILLIRWIVVEPFQIPSGSMIPTLLIHDHILVQKFAYGLNVPLGKNHWLFWKTPQRGDIVVFRYPENPDVYYIKRLMGLPGDTIKVEGQNVSINDKPVLKEPLESKDPSYDYFYEFLENESSAMKMHKVRYFKQDQLDNSEQTFLQPLTQTFIVPEGSYFFMGDNRDESSDSRVWGFVEQKLIIGKAWMIWLSCSSTLESSPQLCDPATIRWGRIFKSLNLNDIKGLD